jgi:uncharacterized protein YbjT (DUF2867 family)
LARALIVGCGCRGRLLGEELLTQGWAVRGTSRREQGLEAIAAAGIEPALADLDRVGTVLEHVADVAVVYLLLGSAAGAPEAVAELHRHRLERLLEKLVDTPVRGVVYEAVGSVDPAVLAAGAELVRSAERTWRIPAAVVTEEQPDHRLWAEEMRKLALELLSPAGEPK